MVERDLLNIKAVQSLILLLWQGLGGDTAEGTLAGARNSHLQRHWLRAGGGKSWGRTSHLWFGLRLP